MKEKLRSLNIVLLLITIMISIFCVVFTSSEVYATGSGNGGEMDADDGGASAREGGVSWTRTGFLFYITSKDDLSDIQTDAVLITKNAVPALDESHFLFATKGKGGASYPNHPHVVDDAPTPVIYEGGEFDTNGDAIKEWLEQELPDGTPMYLSIIRSDYGEKVYQTILEHADEWCVAVEPVAWFNIWLNGKPKDMYFATATNWAALYRRFNQWDGDSQINKFSHKFLPGSMVLEYPMWGYEAYAHQKLTRKLKGSEIEDKGYGIQEFDIKSNSIHTYWEPHGSPGDPEPNTNKPGTSNIVKGYYTENLTTGEKQSLGVYYTLDCTNNIIIDEEDGWELVEWRSTTNTLTNVDPTDWNPPGVKIKEGNTGTTVSLQSPETCVYVLFKKVEGEPEEEPEITDVNYVIRESQISRRICLSQADSNVGWTENIKDHTFNWSIDAHRDSCPGHLWYDSCPGHSGSHNDSCSRDEYGNITCTDSHTWYHSDNSCNPKYPHCSGWQWKDNQLVLKLKNSKSNDYPDILATNGWEKVTSTSDHTVTRVIPITRTSTNEQTYSYKNFDYAAIIHRGSDKLTIALWKNEELCKSAITDLTPNKVSSSGYISANTVQGTRKTNDYNEEFKVQVVDDSQDNGTQYGSTVDSGHGICGDTIKVLHTPDPLEITVKVRVETYSGKTDGGIKDETCISGRIHPEKVNQSGMNTNTGLMVQCNDDVKFLPYIQMRYDTYTETDKDVYVLGQYERGISPNSYAEISWNRTDQNNLNLQSSQWSTHARANSAHEVGTVLPGGAVMYLSTIDGSTDMSQIVRVTTYQPIIVGAGKVQCEKTVGTVSSEFTEETAIKNHQELVESVKQSLDNLTVQQWVNDNEGASVAWSSGGIAVDPGTSLNGLNAASNASTDDKYYFRGADEGTPASQGDLDVQVGTKTAKKYYTFYTKTNGQICLAVENTAPTDEHPALNNGTQRDIDELNERTLIYDKIKVAVERQTGDDSQSKTGTKWYNEAFDGITYVKMTTQLKVGLHNPTERMSVLDPNLCPKNVGVRDLFSTYYLSQFKLRDHSDIHADNKEEVGTFKNTTLYMDNMEYLFKSKKFWIPNVNVQDLH